MRTMILSIILAAYSLTAFPQSVIRTLAWELDTARPAAIEWPVIRGETLDLECRYLASAAPMDVRGAAVTLHARTNGMPADLSFQVTGRVGRVSSTNLASVGWVTVRLRPDLDLPHDVTRCAFTLETTLGDARNLVASGLLRISGDPTGASPAALPVYSYDTAGSAQAVSNALASAVTNLASSVASVRSDLSTSTQNVAAIASTLASTTGDVAVIQSTLPGLATTGALTAAVGGLVGTQALSAAVGGLAGTQALESAVAPLRVPRRWYDQANANRWMEWTGTNVVLAFEIGPPASNLMCQCSFSTALGAELNGTLPFPFSVNGWVSGFMGEGVPFVVYPAEEGSTWMDYDEAVNYPAEIMSSGTGGGGGVLYWQEGAATTNETSRYYLITNAIPPELADLDLLTAWLNSQYASKAALDAAVAAKELHADSYTNLVWRSVFSNGWHWLVAYTNTP